MSSAVAALSALGVPVPARLSAVPSGAAGADRAARRSGHGEPGDRGKLGICEDTAGTPLARGTCLRVHASWLNQVEVHCCVIQRKLLTPDDFEGLDELADQILAFEKHCNATARPFDWKFTRAELNQLLAR